MLLTLILAAGMEFHFPVPLEEPSFHLRRTVPSGGSPFELVLTWSGSNRVTDYEEWFSSIGGKWPSFTYHNGGLNDVIRRDTPPPGVPGIIEVPGYDRFHLYQVIGSGDHLIALYGDPPNRFDVVLDPGLLYILRKSDFTFEGILDFLGYGHPPTPHPEENSPLTFQALRWAEIAGNILYVSNAHQTFSSASGGRNGYITAIDLGTLEVRWRSPSLVSNSANFLLLDDVIISGYGFTGEDDSVHVLSRETGDLLLSVPVPSSPEYLYLNDDTLHVRCFDSDLVFRLVYSR